LLLGVSVGGSAYAQARTDVVTLANGDRITGEVKRLDRGQLEFKTDDAGTIYFEWDNVSRVEAARLFEVGTADGRRFLGTLGSADRGSIAVTAPGGPVLLPLYEVTLITPIGQSIWRKLDGSIDAGFSYTKSSGIAQLNFNSDTVFRRPGFEAVLQASATLTKQEADGTRDDRGSISASYVRYRWPRWFVTALGSFETNESLGLKLRSQVGGAVGPRLVNTNRAQLLLGGGLAFNDERGVDVEPTQNLEAVVTFQTSYFTYDRPRTTIDVSLEYYPSLSDWGRQRIQLDADVKREFWKDLFLSLNLYNSFDSRPPNPEFANNDVGIVLSVGWSY
jgi:hypothetical protein